MDLETLQSLPLREQLALVYQVLNAMTPHFKAMEKSLMNWDPEATPIENMAAVERLSLAQLIVKAQQIGEENAESSQEEEES